MCGIAGEIRFDGAAADIGRVQRMLDLMSARGPDDDGLVAQGRWRWATGASRSWTCRSAARSPCATRSSA
jgi:asparagine synthetase B (glutamine-hydrolysing)